LSINRARRKEKGKGWNMIRFQWDAEKAESNWHKHGVTFKEASSAFEDPHVLTWEDRIVNNEQRWGTLGISRYKRLLFVAHTITIKEDEDEIIRIISARDAEPREGRKYGNRTL